MFIGTATYAFFAGNTNIDSKANLTANAGESYTFTQTSATDFCLNITTSDMSQSKSGNFVSSGNGTINVNLYSPSGMLTACTFDLLFIWVLLVIVLYVVN